MARTVKKKKELTLEEKLEQALVSVDEQPYQVPENWCWSTIGSIISVASGKGLTSKNMNSRGIVPVYGGNGITGYHDKNTVDGITIVIGRVGVYCGCVHYIEGSAWVTDNALIVTYDKSIFIERYIYWLLKNTDLRENDSSSAQPVISGAKIYKLTIPLCPKPEQQRIVDRIESLFAKLDEAKEKAQAVVDGFEDIKQAFLYQAFYGNLTEQWRKSSQIDKKQTWRTKSLQSVCAMKITDGTHKTPTYCNAEEGIPFISAKDVTSGVICWDNIKYIIPKLHEELYERLAPQVDDVLLAKNGTTGVAAIVEEEKIFDLYVTLAVLRPNKDIIDPRYLLNVVNSPICKRQFDEHLTGIGVPNLHLRDIKEVEIPLPSLGEQKEIVRIIDSMSEKWKESQGAAEQVISKIDTMKKSILARAFRGELGTNDPMDESAVELLKRIL